MDAVRAKPEARLSAHRREYERRVYRVMDYVQALVALARRFIVAMLPGYLPSIVVIALRFFLIAADNLKWLNPIIVTGIAFNIGCNLRHRCLGRDRPRAGRQRRQPRTARHVVTGVGR